MLFMNTKKFLAKVTFASLSLLCLLSSCEVDERYDVSKEVDMTISVGKGLSLPIGSTEKIMLSELLDTAATEVLKMDAFGNYSITATGSFNPESFKVNDVDIALASKCSESHYDFNLNNIVQNVEDIEDLPEFVQEQIKQQQYPYVVYNDVEYSTSFDINQSVPEEMIMLSKMSFKEPAILELTLSIDTKDDESNELLKITNELKLLSDKDDDGFIVEVPSFLVFAEADEVTDGKLVLKGVVKYDDAKKAMLYTKKYNIIGLDFSSTPSKCLKVKDGKIELNEVLLANGYVESDTVYFGYDDRDNVAEIDVKCEMAIGNMYISSIEGVFNPKINPVQEFIDLNFSADLDFLKEAYMEVHDPRVYVTFNNPIDADINVNTHFIGLDDNSQPLEGSDINVDLALLGGQTSNIIIDMYGYQQEGYTNCIVDNLNGLLKHLPSVVEIDLDAHVDTTHTSTIELGKDMELYGSYEVSVPLAFDSLRLEYTYSIEDVLGDTEALKNVKDINGLSLSFDVYSTLPAEFVPELTLYDANKKVLKDVKMSITGNIENGKGAVNGEIGEPVKSSVKVSFEAHEGRLKDLYGIDIKLAGIGDGAFNANEYLQIKNINVSIDDYITIDLNK